MKPILNAKDINHPKLERIQADHIRKKHYDSMYKEVDDFLSHKTIEFDYEDEKKIRDSFYPLPH